MDMTDRWADKQKKKNLIIAPPPPPPPWGSLADWSGTHARPST